MVVCVCLCERGGGVYLAIIAVGEHHHKPGLPQPFRLPTGQELVKNHLQQSFCSLSQVLGYG